MGRYELPDPKCNHKRKGRVFAGEPGEASTTVCDRPECIADAIEWAEAQTRKPAQHVPDSPSRGAVGHIGLSENLHVQSRML